MVKTIILDVDETLLHSYEEPIFLDKYSIYSDPTLFNRLHPVDDNDLAYSMYLDGRVWGLYRPHLFEFLDFIQDNYEVVIWSAGTEEYIHEIMKQMFEGRKVPKIIWARNRCADGEDDQGEFYHKPVDKLTNYLDLEADPKSTIIIDDKDYTFTNNPDNGILIPGYRPNSNSIEKLFDRSDDALIKIMKWLMSKEVREAEDIRLVDKNINF